MKTPQRLSYSTWLPCACCFVTTLASQAQTAKFGTGAKAKHGGQTAKSQPGTEKQTYGRILEDEAPKVEAIKANALTYEFGKKNGGNSGALHEQEPSVPGTSVAAAVEHFSKSAGMSWADHKKKARPAASVIGLHRNR